MQAVAALAPGLPADVLRLVDLPDPGVPGPGEARVRMLAATANPSDLITISGAYASRTTFPFVPGFEGVGVVEQVGDGVPASLRGRRVLPAGRAGAWQQVRVLPASWCVPVPDDLDDDTACFAYVNPLTAWLMVDRFCGPGVRSVAISAATSAIGAQLAELLRHRGIAPVGLVRGTPGSAVADPSPWRAVVCTADPGWRQQVRELVPDGLDVVLDAVGGPLGLDLVALLVDGGVLVHYGLLSGVPLPAACFDHRRDTRVEMFRLRDVVHTTPHEQLPALFDPVFDQLRAGRLRTRVGREVGLSGLVEALVHPARGKLLVRID